MDPPRRWSAVASGLALVSVACVLAIRAAPRDLGPGGGQGQGGRGAVKVHPAPAEASTAHANPAVKPRRPGLALPQPPAAAVARPLPATETTWQASATVMSARAELELPPAPFYLYRAPGELSPDHFVKYAAELHRTFAALPGRVTDPDQAALFVTCLSDEINYPVYDAWKLQLRKRKRRRPWEPFAKLHLNITRAMAFVLRLPQYRADRPHLTHFHSGDLYRRHRNGARVVNAAYFSTAYDPAVEVVVPPPAVTRFAFNPTPLLERKYLVVFKGASSRVMKLPGNVSRDHRGEVFAAFRRFHDGARVLIEDKQAKPSHDYRELMQSTAFAVCIEGDLPFSYRLTEIVQAGAIPIIVRYRWSPLPFADVLHYPDFAFVVDPSEVAELMGTTLPALSPSRARSMLAVAQFVNEHYFGNRTTQMAYLLRSLGAPGRLA